MFNYENIVPSREISATSVFCSLYDFCRILKCYHPNRQQNNLYKIETVPKFAINKHLYVMASKLWEKNIQVNHDVEKYTIGRDREMDLFLAPYDILGSIAHITMRHRPV